MTKLVDVTVCELHEEPAALEADWAALVRHVRTANSDLVVLPEMSFSRWLAATPPPEDRAALDAVWDKAVRAHVQWLARLPELGEAGSTPVVVGSRPIVRDKRRLNEAFVWTAEGGLESVHTKVHLPDEEGFWEASWYDPGVDDYTVIEVGGIRLGFLICSELWFYHHARDYMTQGVHLLIVPRATPLSTVDKWLAGGRVAGVVAGAYCLSSNLSGPGSGTAESFGGSGWVTGPDGEVLTVTTSEMPFRTIRVDLTVAEAAKLTYPRYMRG
jgi:N-carbamoylputrescine amidase